MRNWFNSIVCGSAFIIAASGAAFAAPPAPVYNWTGWYAGVNAGASFGDVKTDFNAGPVSILEASKSTVFTITTPALSVSNREYPSGFMGGAQIGYNWQFSPIWVGGLEADFQGALEKDHNTLSTFVTAAGIGCIGVNCQPVLLTGSQVLDYQTKIDWFGTARVRLGYLWGNGDVMSYVTGGLAYGRVSINGVVTPFSAGGPPTIPQPFSQSKINTGWVLGYGTEGRLTGMPGWTWKIEGLYMDLGTLDAGAPGASGTTTVVGTTLTLSEGPLTTHSHFTDSILRAGLSYQFH